MRTNHVVASNLPLHPPCLRPPCTKRRCRAMLGTFSLEMAATFRSILMGLTRTVAHLKKAIKGKEHQTTNSQHSFARRQALAPWPNSSENARRSRKHEPRRSLRRLQMQNRIISDPDVQRDPIETRPDPPHPTKTLKARERQ